MQQRRRCLSIRRLSLLFSFPLRERQKILNNVRVHGRGACTVEAMHCLLYHILAHQVYTLLMAPISCRMLPLDNMVCKHAKPIFSRCTVLSHVRPSQRAAYDKRGMQLVQETPQKQPATPDIGKTEFYRLSIYLSHTHLRLMCQLLQCTSVTCTYTCNNVTLVSPKPWP